MNRLLLVGTLLISTAPLFAQSQQPDMAKLKADAQKVRCSPRSGGYKFQNGTIAQAFQMLGLFIWYLGIWLGNQMTEPTMPVTWNHRVLVFEEHGEKSYCIHEVHYDDDGSILGWTANAIAVCSMRRT